LADWIHYAISSADLNTTCDALKQTEEKESAQHLRLILTITNIVTKPWPQGYNYAVSKSTATKNEL